MLTCRAAAISLGAVVLAAMTAAPVAAQPSGPRCLGHPATIVATGEATAVGTAGPDIIIGSGSGRIEALGGNDRICSPGGDDIEAGDGNDRVRVTGGENYASAVAGGTGADVLTLTGFALVVAGGDGDDVIVARGTLGGTSGDAGNDVISDTGGFVPTTGDDGNDVMTGSRGAILQGGRGHDVVGPASSQGGVTIWDDPGADLYLGRGSLTTSVNYFQAPGPVTANLRTGRVTGPGNGGATDRLVGVRSVSGSSHPDVLIGDDHANILNGIGSDTDISWPLRAGADLVRAGGGDDSIEAAGAGSRVHGDGGADTITTAGANEPGLGSVVHGGPGADEITANGTAFGGPGDDTLTGDFWDDVLDGQAGRDSADGGPGGFDRCVAEVVTSCDA